jgi:hypothetical protein
MGLERGPLSLVSTVEELVGRKSSDDRAVSAGKDILPLMMALIRCCSFNDSPFISPLNAKGVSDPSFPCSPILPTPFFLYKSFFIHSE